MSSFLVRNSVGTPINSVEEWFHRAPPKKGAKQWKDGRSAKELAKVWFKTGEPIIPCELKALLDSHPSTENFVPSIAVPEMVTPLDDFRGEGRNHDLVLLGHVGDRKTLVSIEAKADETFGDIISDRLVRAKSFSKVPDRIALLSQALWGRSIDKRLGRIRYQLLTGLAGTLIEARRQSAVQAVFVIHEFISEALTQDNVNRNAGDLEAFIRTFPAMEETSVHTGIMIDKIVFPGGPFVPGNIPTLIGKVVTHIE